MDSWALLFNRFLRFAEPTHKHNLLETFIEKTFFKIDKSRVIYCISEYKNVVAKKKKKCGCAPIVLYTLYYSM